MHGDNAGFTNSSTFAADRDRANTHRRARADANACPAHAHPSADARI
jgi:hypothetical protein